MKQWTRLMVLLAVPALVWGCKSDPTVPDTVGVAAKLVASPQTVYVAQGDSEAVQVTLVDANGNEVPGEFSFTGPTDANFTVRHDTTEGLIYNADGQLVQKSGATTARFVVGATGFAASSFTVTSGDKSIVVTLTSFPKTLPATFSTGTPTLGEDITVTAPAGTFFHPDAEVTFPGALDPVIISRAPDGSTITFRVAPGTTGPATISNVGISSVPADTFTVSTVATVTLAAIDTVAVVASSTTPNGGTAVTLTGGPGIKFAPTASAQVGGANQITTSVSADSNTLTFLATPGATGPIGVIGAVADLFALGPLPTTVTTFTASASTASVVKMAGTGALATAPTISLAPLEGGGAAGVIDKPPFGFGSGCTSDLGDNCNIYKITVAEETSFHLKLDYDGSSDMGAYFLDATGTAVDASVGFADDNGVAPGPEEGDITLAAGTYYLAVLRFTYAASDPSYYQVTLTAE